MSRPAHPNTTSRERPRRKPWTAQEKRAPSCSKSRKCTSPNTKRPKPSPDLIRSGSTLRPAHNKQRCHHSAVILNEAEDLPFAAALMQHHTLRLRSPSPHLYSRTVSPPQGATWKAHS